MFVESERLVSCFNQIPAAFHKILLHQSSLDQKNLSLELINNILYILYTMSNKLSRDTLDLIFYNQFNINLIVQTIFSLR